MAKNSKNTAHSSTFLKQIEETLSLEKQKLEKELNKLGSKDPEAIDAKFPDYGDKDDENAAEVAEYITNIPLEDNLQKNLRDVTQSLKRIANGAYGICKYCQKPIEEKRLLARPTSSACVECKKAIVQEI